MPYGAYPYGTVQYAEELSDREGTGEAAPDMLRHLPEFYAGDPVVRMLLEVAALPVGDLLHGIQETLKQFYVSTASWGLSAWEEELGLTIDPTKPAERRREQLQAKLQGTGTVTKAMIVQTAAAFSGGTVEIVEYPAESRFVVKFVGVLGIPPNMPGFIQMLQTIKPAHLSFSFEYTYTLWDNVKPLTWNTAEAQTWNQLRTYEGE